MAAATFLIYRAKNGWFVDFVSIKRKRIHSPKNIFPLINAPKMSKLQSKWYSKNGERTFQTSGQCPLFFLTKTTICLTHVLLHLVKSSCPNSVNPFSTLFSADIQHNCPILFGICPTYLPAGHAFRFSFQKQLHLHFQGKWPLAPSSFERMCYSHSYVWKVTG